MMLIVLQVYSQDTIPIHIDQAKQAIRNAQRVAVIKQQIKLQDLIIQNQQEVVLNLKQQVGLEQTKYKLLNQNYEFLNTQYNIEKSSKKKKTLVRDILIVIGVFGTGFMVGSL